MQELNKFQIFTVAFLLIFVFVIGAIYTNTKEVAENRMNAIENSKNANSKTYQYRDNESVTNEQENISNLFERVGLLEQKMDSFAPNSNSKSLKCRIEGIMNGDEFVSISQEEALEEAKYNKRDIVMLCNF